MPLSESSIEAVLRAAYAADITESISVVDGRYVISDSSGGHTRELCDAEAASLVEILLSAARTDFRDAWWAVDTWMAQGGVDLTLSPQAQRFVRPRSDHDLSITQITTLLERFNNDDHQSIMISGSADVLVAGGVESALAAFVNCSDFFAYACADAHTITSDLYEEIIATAQCYAHLDDVEFYAPLLVVAKARRARPIASRMDKMPSAWRDLFETSH